MYLSVKLEMVEETGGLPSVPVTFLLVSVVLAGLLLLTRSVAALTIPDEANISRAYLYRERNNNLEAGIAGAGKASLIEGIQKQLKCIFILGQFRRDSESFF